MEYHLGVSHNWRFRYNIYVYIYIVAMNIVSYEYTYLYIRPIYSTSAINDLYLPSSFGLQADYIYIKTTCDCSLNIMYMIKDKNKI